MKELGIFTAKTKSPQTNGICERFHKTVFNEFYRVSFRKKVYRSIDELQADLDAWIGEYNEQRMHQGRWSEIAVGIAVTPARAANGPLKVSDRY
jgi:transposase InsO family protein